MKYAVNRNTGISSYLQLYEQIKSDIVAGFYEYGQKLPSKRIIAEDAGVSVITAEHAYRLLCDEGYAESVERSGYFVEYKKGDFIRADREVSTISHNAKINQFSGGFPFSILAKKMRKVISDCGDGLLQKSPNSGCEPLQSAVSHYLARSIGIIARPEQVIIGSGAEYLYGIIVQLLGRSIYALENPSYDKIRKVYEAHSVNCEMLSMGADGILTEDLGKSRAGVLHVTPFNSFPSGISADVSKRREYLEWAHERDAYIIEDNYDSELTVSKKFDDTLYSMDTEGRVIYLNTFSNTIAPSLRVGYMILPDSLLDKFRKKLAFYSCTVPVFDQLVIAELLTSGDFERHINRVRRKKRKQEYERKGV